MINNLSLVDENDFIYLGSLLHDNFSSLYNLEDVLNSTYYYAFGYYLDDKLIAFLLISKIYDVIDILDIVVSPKWRSMGIATKLFQYCFNKFTECTYMLEVNKENFRAISLYEKLGFAVISIRKKYYHGVDALVMKRVDKCEKC